MDLPLSCRQAIDLHQRGDLPGAERLCRKILAADPVSVVACQLLAGIRVQQKRPAEALSLYDAALASNPDHPGLLYNRGVVLGDLGHPDEALRSFDRAVAVHPAFVEAWNNRGFTLQDLKRYEEALSSFDRALAVAPDFAEAWVNRGVALRQLHRLDEALASFERALAGDPGFVEAWNGRGFILQQLGRLAPALTSFERALALDPIHAQALFNLASVLCESDRVEDGFAAFRRHADLVSQAPALGADPPHKASHDAERRAYLASDEAKAPAPPPVRRAVNPPAAADEVAARWTSSRPQIVVIDDLLTDDALGALRRFCAEADIWRGAYADGYLGAMPEHGFASPLLAQIAQELREAFPAVLGAHALQYLWAFKYDSRLSGIKVHADRAAVNVNFWITPDEANLDPESGGLVIWDAVAPADWSFDKYNADPQAIRDVLAQAGARKVTIPYRANRAVIFDSDLFHQTDTIAFRDGYLNRRVNVTMLYGRRDANWN